MKFPKFTGSFCKVAVVTAFSAATLAASSASAAPFCHYELIRMNQAMGNLSLCSPGDFYDMCYSNYLQAFNNAKSDYEWCVANK
jgi:hypothetical protein